MLDIINKLKSGVFINKIVAEIGITNAQKLIKKINQAINLIEEKELEEKIRKENNKAAVKQIKNDLKKAGLTVNDLGEVKSKKIIKPKYKITIENEVHTWTGRGRIPQVFKEVKNDLDKYLIK